MAQKHRCLMIGVGGMARHWINSVWANQRDRMEIVALLDVNDELLRDAGETLGVPPSRQFTDAGQAFATADADCCCVVSPPQFHRQAVELACTRGMHILSEKPIADSWESCAAIYRMVRMAGVKMMVTQNYRYTSRILTLKKAVQELGPVNYAVCRYASDYRRPLSWGAPFRHEMAHSLLVEASIHHFDQLRNLTGADCQILAGFEWHPGQLRGGADRYRGSDSFAGETNGLFLMQMTGAVFGSYEGNNLATGKTNSWHSEYYRVECEGGAAVLDVDHVVRIEQRGAGGTLQVRDVRGEQPRWEGHHAVGAQFLDWLDGGEAPATVLQDNIKSAAMLFAAVEAGATKRMVDVAAKVRDVTGA
jgi:predicted dehydrogenase